MIRIALNGALGRMGNILAELIAEESDLTLAAAIDRSDQPVPGMPYFEGIQVTDSMEAALADADVLVDFSSPEGAVRAVQASMKVGRPMVSGTTGLGESERAVFEQATLQRKVGYYTGSDICPNRRRGRWDTCILRDEFRLTFGRVRTPRFRQSFVHGRSPTTDRCSS